jgi:hypothetical protein
LADVPPDGWSRRVGYRVWVFCTEPRVRIVMVDEGRSDVDVYDGRKRESTCVRAWRNEASLGYTWVGESKQSKHVQQ